MLQSGWIFVGVVALVATGVAVWTDDDGIAIVTGVAGFITWGVWTYGALSVEVQDQGAIETYTMPELALLGLVFALAPGYIALTGPVSIVGRTDSPDTTDL